MRFKLFKSVSNVLISSLVVLFQLGENLRYTRISSKNYFSPHVFLRDEFLRYLIFSDRKVWCLSSQTHFQSRSFDYPNHLYNLIYGNKALCGILEYLKFSPSWNKTTRYDMSAFETDLKAQTSYFMPLNHLRPSRLILNSCTLVHHIAKVFEN